MSLLHDALKKAEQEGGEGKGPSDEGQIFVDTEEPKKAPKGRIYLLSFLTLMALGVAVYVNVFRVKTEAPPIVGPKLMSTPLGIAGGPGAEDLARQSNDLLRTGRWDEAKTILEKLIILEPRNAEGYNNLGLVLKKLGDKERAVEQYRKAIAIEASYPEAMNNLGVIYLGEGRLPEALDQFQQASALKPDYAEPYFHMALIDEAQGRVDAARKNYEKFLEFAKNTDPGLVIQVRERIDGLESSG